MPEVELAIRTMAVQDTTLTPMEVAVQGVSWCQVLTAVVRIVSVKVLERLSDKPHLIFISNRGLGAENVEDILKGFV